MVWIYLIAGFVGGCAFMWFIILPDIVANETEYLRALLESRQKKSKKGS